MRRLTDFEKDIVEKIHSLEVTEFDDLVKPILDNEFYFYFLNSKNGNIPSTQDTPETEYTIVVETTSKLNTKQEKKFFSNKVLLKFNLIVNIERLVRLFEQNGLVNIYLFDRTFRQPIVIGKHYNFEDIVDDEVIRKVRIIQSKEYVERLMSITNSSIYPTPALEIYKKNLYRTDEQKLNDEALKQNELNNVYNETSIKLAAESVKAALHTALYSLIAVAVAGLATLFTLGYTIYHDNKKDNIELANSKIEAKKDSLNDFYQNEVILRVEKIAEELELKKKEVPVEPVVKKKG